VLKSQDILVLLKLAEHPPAWTLDGISKELAANTSSVHRSLQRAAAAGLYDPEKREIKPHALLEFVVHGLKYVFPPEWGGEARGRPTAWKAPPLSKQLPSSGNPPVWADARGEARGIHLEPLHPSVPRAVRDDPLLWELLALVDAIRIGNARERELAAAELEKRFYGPPDE
jgi:hypothetical protein